MGTSGPARPDGDAERLGSLWLLMGAWDCLASICVTTDMEMPLPMMQDRRNPGS